jgi:hypothetical protein
VYPCGDKKALKQVEQMRSDGRVQMFSEADYSHDRTACLWLCNKIEEFAERIRNDEKNKLSLWTERKPPQHLT